MDRGERSPAQLGRIVDLRPPGALLALSSQYGGSEFRIVDELFGQAYALGAQMALIEYDYRDPDMQSERGWPATTSRSGQTTAGHRIHFFVEPPTVDLNELESVYDLSDLSYLGWMVVRPQSAARIGQTLFPPPPDLQTAVSCTIESEVNVFGYTLSVQAVPFMAIDPHAGGRVEASLWMCARLYLLGYGQRPLLLEDVAGALPPGLGVGHSITQIAEGSRALGLPALIYNCQNLPANETVASVASRYLNSGMPVMAVTRGRSLLVLIGYRWFDGASTIEPTHFVCHDCEVGPYQIVESTNIDEEQNWEQLIIPCPADVLVTGEVAEELGKARIRRAFESKGNGESGGFFETLIPSFDEPARIVFRSTLVHSNQFKAGVRDRGASPLLEGLYRRLTMPRWIWVVEAVQIDSQIEDDLVVVSEILIDATERTRDLTFVAMRIPGELWSWLPGTDDAAIRPTPSDGPLRSIAHHATSPGKALTAQNVPRTVGHTFGQVTGPL